MHLREERLVPWEMIGTTDNENIDLEELLFIKGVERVSPVIRFDTEIQFGEYKLNCQVQAVHSSFLDIELIEGAVYYDNSNMPFLLLNKYAAESFSVGDNEIVTVNANADVVMTINNNSTSALICGIFEDGKEIPVVYMSFDLASKKLSSLSEMNLIFALNNKNNMEQVVSSLQQKDISAIYDWNEVILLESKSQQMWQLFLVSICLLFCSTSLVQNRCLQFDKLRKEENYALALVGMTVQQIRWIASLRLIFLHFISLMIACWISFVAGMFSLLAVFICLLSLCIHFSLFMKCQMYN